MSTVDRDQRLERVIQRLEESVLRDRSDSGAYLRSDSQQARGERVPARIRDIITRSLATDDSTSYGMDSSPSNAAISQMAEENRMLQGELSRVEDLLAASRAERDELGIKYNAMTEKLEKSLALDNGDHSEGEGLSKNSLMQQNIELRRRLEDEHSHYKTKLQSYQDSQQRQAQLVQKLQAKVLQYKKKCTEMDTKMSIVEQESQRTKRMQNDYMHTRHDTGDSRMRMGDEDHLDLETALIKLEEEQQRSSGLAHVNGMLRDQLDQATAVNQSLTSDVTKLTDDWQRAKEELERREAEWRDEEQSFNEYFSTEHSRLLALWREVVAYRRQYNELKNQTERDLANMKNELVRNSRAMHSATLNLAANLRCQETQVNAAADRDRTERSNLEAQLKEKVREVHELQARLDQQVSEMNARTQDLTLANERLKIQLAEKERTLTTLQRIRGGERAEVVEAPDEATRALIEETEAMHTALRDIAQAVINDADAQGHSMDSGEEESRSTARPLRSARSPARGSSPSARRGRSRSPAFADSTYSAVQAALDKRALQVQELRAKLSGAKENSTTLKKALDDSENERRRLEHSVMGIREELDNSRREREDTLRDRDRFKNALDVTGCEKSQLEQVRSALNQQMDALHSDLERLHLANSELQRRRDELEDQLDDVRKDGERQLKENERCQKVIQTLEERLTKAKEEEVGLRDSLNRVTLDKEVLEQECSEAGEALTRTESLKVERELEVNKLRSDEASLRDALHKMQVLNEGLKSDLREQDRLLQQGENEREGLCREKRTLDQEKQGIKEELIRCEQEKLDLSNERARLTHDLEIAENNRERQVEELNDLNKIRLDLIEKVNALSRENQSLKEEIHQLSRVIDRHSSTIKVQDKEKERLFKTCNELDVQCKALEREAREQANVIASQKSEKEQLESGLYEAQQLIEQLDTRKSQLEGENQELLIRKEQQAGEMMKMRKEFDIEAEKLARQRDQLGARLTQTEKDLKLALQQEQESHQDDLDRLTREKEAQRCEMEGVREQIINNANIEKEEMINRYEREKEELANEVISIQRERDDSLLMAESEKQQALSVLEQERCMVQERLMNCQMQLKSCEADLDRTRREAAAKAGQDHETIQGLELDLRKLNEDLQETCVAQEKKTSEMNLAREEVQAQREQALREVAELKVQLKMVEEARDNVRRDLIESNRQVRIGDETMERQKKDIFDLKRCITEEQREKETIEGSNEELRKKVKECETERIDLGRIIAESKKRIEVLEGQKAAGLKDNEELHTNVREREKNLVDAKREIQELRRGIKQLQGERAKLLKEAEDLNVRISKDEERDEENRREIFGLKQRLVETEASRDALRKELANTQRRLAETEDALEMKERDYARAMEDARREYGKLSEAKRSVEIALDSANGDNMELRKELGGAESRISVQEADLARKEGAKKDLEFKLASIHSSLRRLIGFRQERPRSVSPSRGRSISPQRRSRPTSPSKGFDSSFEANRDQPRSRDHSPMSRSMSPSRGGDIADIDPEAVRLALRDFVQQLVNAERERDDAFAHARSLQCQLEDQSAVLDQTENRLQMLQHSLREVEEDKQGTDGRLASAQTAILLQEESLQRGERERKALSDKISNLERQIAAIESEKRQLLEKISRLKQNESRADEERKHQKRCLDDAENRCTQLELAKRGLEGDLQRMRLTLNDKDTEVEVLADRVEAKQKQIADLESKAQSLQLALDRQSTILAKTAEEGSVQKDKVQQLNLSLTDQSAMIQELQEKLSQVQKALTSSEQDRRILQERLDKTRGDLNEAKHQNHRLMEQVQQVQAELADSELRRNELEGLNRQSGTLLVQRQEAEQEMNQRLQKLTAEKQALSERINSLQRSLSEAEGEKRNLERGQVRLEKDKTALRRTLDKIEREKMRSEEVASKTVMERSEMDTSLRRLDDENMEMKRAVQNLQAQLAEAEQAHAARLIEITSRHRAETEMEVDHLRAGKMQIERTLEARERSHRQRVKGLEEQVSTLKDQLGQEVRKRNQYLSRSARTSTDVNEIRALLDSSLANVARDPSLDAALLEAETRRLDDALDLKSAPTRLSPAPRVRSPTRTGSPTRSTPIGLRRSPLALYNGRKSGMKK